MCQAAVVFYPRCNHIHCPHSSSVYTCRLNTDAPTPEPVSQATYDILATPIQLCPSCYKKEEIAILTIYTTALTEQYDRKAGEKLALRNSGSTKIGKRIRWWDVEIANLKIEMVDKLTKLREGQGVPKEPEKEDRVRFDFRGPEIVQVENWLGKENLWPDEDGDIELRDAK